MFKVVGDINLNVGKDSNSIYRTLFPGHVYRSYVRTATNGKRYPMKRILMI